MKKFKILLILVLAILISNSVFAESTLIKFTSKVHPKYIIDEIKEKPYLLFFSLGKYYFNNGDLEKSKKYFKYAIKFKEDFSPAHHNLGVIEYQQRNYDGAKYSFKKAIEVDKNNKLPHYSLGILYFELGEFDLAIDSFNNALALDPNNPNYNFDLAQGYVAKFRENEQKLIYNYTDLELAVKYIKITINISPEFANAENNLNIIKDILNTRESLIN